jgi:hypothetical protein
VAPKKRCGSGVLPNETVLAAVLYASPLFEHAPGIRSGLHRYPVVKTEFDRFLLCIMILRNGDLASRYRVETASQVERALCASGQTVESVHL